MGEISSEGERIVLKLCGIGGGGAIEGGTEFLCWQ